MALFWVEVKENVVGKLKGRCPVLAVHKTNERETTFLIPDNDGEGIWVDSQGCIILTKDD